MTFKGWYDIKYNQSTNQPTKFGQAYLNSSLESQYFII